MAEHRNLTSLRFRKIRRAMNLRLERAEREGRLAEEMARIERHGKQLYHELMNGSGRHRRRRKRG